MPLWAKVEATKIRLVEFYNHYNGNVTISYSGGKDSTVLAYIANDMLGLNIPLVFSNTGLEYAQIQKFARAKGAEFIRPEMLFSEVISQYGYPIISKVVSEAIYYARRIPKDTTPPCWCREHLLGRATMPERQYAESNASRTIQRMVREPSRGGQSIPTAKPDTRQVRPVSQQQVERPGDAGVNSWDNIWNGNRTKKGGGQTAAESLRRRSQLLGQYGFGNPKFGAGVVQGGNRSSDGTPVAAKRQELSGQVTDGSRRGEGGYDNLVAQNGEDGNRKDGKKSMFNKDKWLPASQELPFKISHYCCSKMKKSPLAKYERKTKKIPIIATMAEESQIRRQSWIRNGCNAYQTKDPKSQPMAFWTEQDVLQFIVENNIEICSVYGNIEKDEKGKYKCSGCNRTGCVYCMFGAHNKNDHRFEVLAEQSPNQFEYAMRGGNGSTIPTTMNLPRNTTATGLTGIRRKYGFQAKRGLA